MLDVTIKVKLTDGRGTTEKDAFCKEHNQELSLLDKVGEALSARRSENWFWYYLDDADRSVDRNSVGLELEYRLQAPGLESVVYLLQIFEASCRLIEVPGSRLSVRLALSLK